MANDRGKGKKMDDEDPPPPNKRKPRWVSGEGSSKDTETSQSEYKKVITSDDYEEEEEPLYHQQIESNLWDWRGDSWDWRDIDGIIGPTLNQGTQATCWACAVTRSVQALYNIGLGHLRNHRQLSVQHLVNNVNFDMNDGIGNTRGAFAYVKSPGICTESHCKQRKGIVHKSDCRHGQQAHLYNIDGYETITDVDDARLVEHVRRQPVVGVLPLTDELSTYGTDTNHRIYNSLPNPLQPPRGSHVVLIIGYGNDRSGRPYWIIQNSWGEAWGFEGGFGYIYRQTNSKRSSLFTEVQYPWRRRDGA